MVHKALARVGPHPVSTITDLIFAKGYVEGVSYVKMAKIMPKYSTAEIEAEWQRLGLSDEDRPQSAMGSTAVDV